MQRINGLERDNNRLEKLMEKVSVEIEAQVDIK